MLFEGAGAPRAALPAAQTTAEVIPDDGADGGYEAGGMPEEPDDAPDFDDPDAIFCDDCGEQIVETRAKDGRIWTPENIKGYSERKFGRCLCTRCQRRRRPREEADKHDGAAHRRMRGARLARPR